MHQIFSNGGTGCNYVGRKGKHILGLCVISFQYEFWPFLEWEGANEGNLLSRGQFIF